MLQSFTVSIDAAMTTIMTLVNIAFFIRFANLPLLPSFIVYAIGFYMRLCNSVGFNFSRAFITVVNMKVSVDRLKKFLLIKELEDKRKDLGSSFVAVEMQNFNYSWKKDQFSIKNISMQINKGDFAAIVGPVGSGKVVLNEVKV